MNETNFLCLFPKDVKLYFLMPLDVDFPTPIVDIDTGK